MNRQETAKVLAYLLADFGQPVSAEKLQVWHDQLRHRAYPEVMTAARVLMGRKMYGAPRISDLLNVLEDITSTHSLPLWGEAFDMWIGIAKKYGYNRRGIAVAEYREKCPFGYRALGTMANDYWDLKSDDKNTFRAQFRQRYESLTERETKYAALPPHIASDVNAIRLGVQTRMEELDAALAKLAGPQDENAGDAPVRIGKVLPMAIRKAE